jgi:hypothetical protein
MTGHVTSDCPHHPLLDELPTLQRDSLAVAAAVVHVLVVALHTDFSDLTAFFAAAAAACVRVCGRLVLSCCAQLRMRCERSSGEGTIYRQRHPF